MASRPNHQMEVARPQLRSYLAFGNCSESFSRLLSERVHSAWSRAWPVSQKATVSDRSEFLIRTWKRKRGVKGELMTPKPRASEIGRGVWLDWLQRHTT